MKLETQLHKATEPPLHTLRCTSGSPPPPEPAPASTDPEGQRIDGSIQVDGDGLFPSPQLGVLQFSGADIRGKKVQLELLRTIG